MRRSLPCGHTPNESQREKRWSVEKDLQYGSSCCEMSMVQTFLAVTLFWFILFLIDRVIRNYRPWSATYHLKLEEWGVSLTFAHVRCYTTKFNRFFQKVGTWSKYFCRLWFTVGALSGVLLMFTSIGVLAFTLFQTLSASEGTQQVLTPVMPGVNLPWRDLSYYVVTLIVCGVFHEAGHAVAASLEQVRVNGFGIFLLFLYPGAFVDLHSDHLAVISPKRQLRIYCAGVWHNVILVLCSLLLLWGLPLLLAPFYTTGIGAHITSVQTGNVLTDKLRDGELITKMNTCPVHSATDWYECIDRLASEKQHGYCQFAELLERQQSFAANQTTQTEDGGRECCEKGSQSDLCFEVFYTKGRPRVFQCLTARTVSARETCHHSRDCTGLLDFACVVPAVSPETRLVRISHSDGPDVLFLGDPRALIYSLLTSSYLPNSSLSPPWLPNMLQTLLMYMISFSSALALLNMVPAYYLDGQWAFTVLVELCFENSLQEKTRRQICSVVLVAGSVLLAANIGLALWTLTFW